MGRDGKCAVVYLWPSESNLQKSVLSVHRVGLSDWIQVIGLVDKHLYLLSHILNPDLNTSEKKTKQNIIPHPLKSSDKCMAAKSDSTEMRHSNLAEHSIDGAGTRCLMQAM